MFVYRKWENDTWAFEMRFDRRKACWPRPQNSGLRAGFSPWAILAGLALLVPLGAAGQSVVSARAGMLHYVEGRVLLEDELIEYHPARFLYLKPQERLRTEDGRAEVQLALGSFLRLAEDSEIQMLSVGVTSASARVIAGSVILDSSEVFDKDSLSLVVGNAQIQILKSGLYRVDAGAEAPLSVKVFRGKVAILVDGGTHEVKSKRGATLLQPPDTLSIAKFDRSERDAFDEWNRTRASEIAKSNRPPKQPKHRDDSDLIRTLPDRLRAGIGSSR